MKICIDPGHGMSNKRSGIYDSGAVYKNTQESTIAMDWANELKAQIELLGHSAIRTRINENDPCPVTRRDDIARSYKCDRMISLHCNCANGKASGSEVFYRGNDDKEMAMKLSEIVSSILGIKNRGAKTENESQHTSLAVMEFDKCWLIEIGFIDNEFDRNQMLNKNIISKCCKELAKAITSI